MNINLQEVPEKLKKSFILCERILDSVFLVDNSYVYEVKKKSIISSLLLQQNSNDEKLTEQMQIDGAGNDRLQGFCRYDECSVKSVYILILVHSNLFVVQKKDFGLYKMYNNVKDFQIVDELSDGNCKVEIQFHGSSMLTTNFLDYIEKSTSSSKDSFSGIEDAISEMRNNTNEIKGQIAQLEASMDKLFLSVNRNLKFVPNSLISDSADEKQPLVRYGDIWTKLHNEKLVIGIPVLNCTYKQKLVLEDLKLILLDSELNTLEYSWNLYKMRTDCFTFENFEELFDKIDETKDFPNFDQDWNLCKNRILNAEQSAIFLATIDVENFLELLEYNLKIFLTYDISLDIPQKSMQLHVGNLAINPQKIWDSNYLVDFTNQHEIYRNLLTVSSTSFNITLELNYKEAPKHVLADFLLDTLKFQLIRRIHSEEFMDQQTFYASENYFNGLLVRTSQKDHLMINLKLYAKFEHQIVKLVQAIYTNYGEECTVTLQNKFDEEIARKMLEQCLIEEIGHTLGDQTSRDFIRKQLQKELCTDISYQNLKRKL